MGIKHLPEPKEFASNFERDNDLVKFVNGLIDVLKGYAEADVENYEAAARHPQARNSLDKAQKNRRKMISAESAI